MTSLLPEARSLLSSSRTTRGTASTASFSDDLLALLATTFEVVILLLLLEFLHGRLLEVLVAESDGVVAAAAFRVCFDDFATHVCSGVEVGLPCWSYLWLCVGYVMGGCDVLA